MKKTLLTLTFAGVFLGACAGVSTGKQELDAGDFMAKNLLIESIEFKGNSLVAQGFDEQPSISFDNDKFYGYSGCNRFFGSYESVSGGLRIDENGGSTKMLCHPNSVMEFEQTLLSNLKGKFNIVKNGEKVSLENNELKIFFK